MYIELILYAKNAWDFAIRIRYLFFVFVDVFIFHVDESDDVYQVNSNRIVYKNHILPISYCNIVLWHSFIKTNFAYGYSVYTIDVVFSLTKRVQNCSHLIFTYIIYFMYAVPDVYFIKEHSLLHIILSRCKTTFFLLFLSL